MLSRIISQLDEEDATKRYDVEGEDNKVTLPETDTSNNNPPRKIISWEDGDPENPFNWPVVCPLAIVD